MTITAHYTPADVAIASICVDTTEYTHAGLGSTGTYRNITMHNHKEYARVHGYKYRVLTVPIVTQHSNVSMVYWHKSFLVLQLLVNFKWVFWTDCDALFMNFSIPLPIPNTTKTNVHMVISGDYNNAINTGQFLIDNSIWSKNIMSNIHTNLKPECGDRFDNAAFNWVLWGNCAVSKGWASSLKACESKLKQAIYPNALKCANINTYPSAYERMSTKDRLSVFRVHFPGDQRKKLMYAKKYNNFVYTG